MPLGSKSVWNNFATFAGEDWRPENPKRRLNNDLINSTTNWIFSGRCKPTSGPCRPLHSSRKQECYQLSKVELDCVRRVAGFALTAGTIP
jgi:hypothetical protein